MRQPLLDLAGAVLEYCVKLVVVCQERDDSLWGSLSYLENEQCCLLRRYKCAGFNDQEVNTSMCANIERFCRCSYIACPTRSTGPMSRKVAVQELKRAAGTGQNDIHLPGELRIRPAATLQHVSKYTRQIARSFVRLTDQTVSCAEATGA